MTNATELSDDSVFRYELLLVLKRIATSIEGIEELITYQERRAEKESRFT